MYKSENNDVIIGQKDWNSVQETLYLESTGTIDKVKERYFYIVSRQEETRFHSFQKP